MVRILGIACVVLLMMGAIQSDGWRGIVPLQSTRADVERLLGPPREEGGLIYEQDDAGIFIEYSLGPPCEKGKPRGWNVPPDTVLQMSVSLNPSPEFSALNLDLETYKKTPDPELPGVVHYTNREEGIGYEVQNGKVTSTSYFPMAKDKHLRCP